MGPTEPHYWHDMSGVHRIRCCALMFSVPRSPVFWPRRALLDGCESSVMALLEISGLVVAKSFCRNGILREKCVHQETYVQPRAGQSELSTFTESAVVPPLFSAPLCPASWPRGLQSNHSPVFFRLFGPCS